MSKKEVVLATLVVHGVNGMTTKCRQDMSRWLWKTAWELYKHPDKYAKVFRARYMGVGK